MQIVELVSQGLRAIPGAQRLAIKPGYTLLHAPQGGVSLWTLFEVLCFPDPRKHDRASLSDINVTMARVGLTFQGKDGFTYRLVREIGGSGTLAKQDAATQKFLPVTSDSNEIAQYLRAALGIPTRGAYEQVFTLQAGQWPSAQPARLAPAGPQLPAGLGLSGGGASLALATQEAPGVAPVANVAEAQAQVAKLREELDRTKEVEDAQFRLDGANRKIFEASQKTKKLDTFRKEAAAASAAAEAAPSTEALGLPDNVIERAQRWETNEKSREDQLMRLAREREQFEGKQREATPLVQDQAFLVSAFLGVLFFGIGMWLGHGWRYLALLDIPAFGFAAVQALRWVTDVQSNESLGRRQGHFADKEKQIHEAFENEVLSVRMAMKVLQQENPADLIAVLSQRPALLARAAEAERQVAELESNPDVLRAQEEIVVAQRELSMLETRVSVLSSFSRQTHSIEAEIDELEAGIKAALHPGAARPASSAGIARPASSAGLLTQRGLGATAPSPTLGLPPGGQAQADDPCPRLLGAVTDLFGLDLVGLGQHLTPRATQYLAALSDRRFTAIEFNHLGQATLTGASGRQAVAQLEVADRDILYLAVKLTLMEKAAEKQKLPLILDDPLGKLDGTKVTLVSRLLKHIGTKTQVLHVASSLATQGMADQTIDLGAR